MPYLARFVAAVALVAAGTIWLLSALPWPVALLLAVLAAWVVFDLVQPEDVV